VLLAVRVAVNVAVPVAVDVAVPVWVRVAVSVAVGVDVTVPVSVVVAVRVGVAVPVAVAVEVDVAVVVAVDVRVAVLVLVGAAGVYTTVSCGASAPSRLSKSWRGLAPALSTLRRIRSPRLTSVPVAHACARLVTFQLTVPRKLLDSAADA
jgi:hypothetical protein